MSVFQGKLNDYLQDHAAKQKHNPTNRNNIENILILLNVGPNTEVF